MYMCYRGYRGGLSLAMLLAALAVSLCAAAGPLKGPVNARFLWQLDEEADLNDFRGFWAGVLSEEGSEQPELVVVWSWDDQSFWPLWRVQLVAGRGVLAGDGQVKALDAIGPWSELEAMTLTGGTPLPGHRYEVCLSYDPELGGLSVAIEDLTVGREVVVASVGVSVPAGSFRVATDLLSEAGAGEKTLAQIAETEPGYVPWGIRWHVATGERLTPSLHLERVDDAFLELTMPHALRGEFEFSLLSGERRTPLGKMSLSEGGRLSVPLQISEWPLGPVSLELSYREESGVLFSDHKDFVVGRLTADFEPPVTDEDQQTVQTVLRLQSKDTMKNVAVRVEGQWLSREWDAARGGYREQAMAEPFTVFSGVLDVVGPDDPGQVALSIPVIQEPGFWRLRLTPKVDLDVVVQASSTQMLVFKGPPAAEAAPRYDERWVYVSRNLTQEKHVEDIRQIVTTAVKHGLNGLVWAGGADSLSRWDAKRLDRLAQVKTICEGAGIELIPLAFSAGYGGGVLGHNPNLAAALPARDVLYVVEGSTARLASDPPVSIPNGDLSRFRGHRFEGINFHDQPGLVSFVDEKVYRSAPASIRFGDMALHSPQHGHARLMAEVEVQPHRQYRFSAWVKTQDLNPAPFLLQIYYGDRVIGSVRPTLAATQDWTQVSCTFNSLDATKVRLYAGLWGGKTGYLWIDDLQLEEMGLRSVVRRPGAPLTVTNYDGTVTYIEGRDFAAMSDPNLSRFGAPMAGPDIRILPESGLKDGDRLRVSFYHAVTISGGQTSLCMSEPELYEYWGEQVRLIHRYLAPSRYLLSMDEIRAGGSCRACKDRGMTMGEILGDCISRLYDMIKEVNPEATVYIWSDMLDPNHNARDNYFMVDGDYTGSWLHIPKDIVSVCWHHAKRNESLSFFSGQGFETLAGAYYDGDTLDNPRDWLEALDETPGARGIMYTTWQNKYELLPDFGDLVREWK